MDMMDVRTNTDKKVQGSVTGLVIDLLHMRRLVATIGIKSHDVVYGTWLLRMPPFTLLTTYCQGIKLSVDILLIICYDTDSVEYNYG